MTTLEFEQIVALDKQAQDSITPLRAVELLKEGNERFVEDRRLDRNHHDQIKQTSTGQYPFAAVLSCIDSRVPAELVFDLGIGDIFNVRIAGNFINDDILGSLEFACKVAGAKAILILGHSSCGAVKGAIQEVELGNLTGMLDKIKPAVNATKAVHGNKPHDHPEFIQGVARTNVIMNMYSILQKSQVLKEMHDNGEITLVGGMYNVETGNVEFIES